MCYEILKVAKLSKTLLMLEWATLLSSYKNDFGS